MSALVETVVPARLGPRFRWLLASSWTTNLGDGIALAAGSLLVASLTTDAFLVSLAALLRWAPALLFGLYAGVLSDRKDRRVIVVVANLARAVVLVAIVVLLLTRTLTVGAALVGLGLIAVSEVFADNTSQTLLPMLVDRDDLALANARLQTGFLTLNRLAGPPIGAALFAAGRAWPFVTETLLVVGGVLLVLPMRLPPHGREPGVASSVRRDVAEGIRWTLRHPAVRTLALTILVLALTRSAWFASAVLVVFGAHAFIWGTTSVTVRQRAVPTELQGRVSGVYVLAVFGGLVIGSALRGGLANRHRVTAPF